MTFDIEAWYGEINKGDVIVNHKGVITNDLITEILSIVENKLIERKENTRIRKKIYNVMVEALQNLFHHTDKLPNETNDNFGEKFVTFVLKKEKEDKFSYISGNYILKSRVKFLKDRIDQIKYLTHEELQLLYKLILNNNEFSDKGGGGLGLVDIAKRTGNNFEYFFHENKKDHCFFCLKILITN
ncbi:MAG: SiaB family protein kinase [Bacteroidales bacterium]|nr:SiaB family protein kinase [Bacteroidales bacterium]